MDAARREERRGFWWTNGSGETSLRPGMSLFGPKNDRWMIYDPDGNFSGEFRSAAEAGDTAKRWNDGGSEIVTIAWKKGDSSDEFDRGVYTVSIAGTRFSRSFSSGWNSMASAARFAGKLRDAVATHGADVVHSLAEVFDR